MINNVVALPRGANQVAAKGSVAKSGSKVDEDSQSSAEVTPLFPRGKANGGASSKAHKTSVDAKSDSSKTKDSTDQTEPTNGQDLFGSLVASVEQKLTQQDFSADQQSTGDTAATGTSVEVSQASRLNLRFSLSDSLQKLKQEFSKDGIKIDDVSPKTVSLLKGAVSVKSADDTPAVDSAVADAASAEEETEAGVRVAEVVEATSTDLSKSVATTGNGQTRGSVSAKLLDIGGQSKSVPSDGTPINAASVGHTTDKNSLPSFSASEKDGKSASDEKQEPAKPDETVASRSEAQDGRNSNVNAISMQTGGPAKALSPAAQIVENIRSALPAAPASGAPPTPTVKNLEIQLQPEGLGQVTVSLKSEQGKLKVQVSARLETTRQELERNSAELVSGLQRVDPTFKDADVNFSNQNQGTGADTGGQTFSNGSERRGTPENMAQFGSSGGQDADHTGNNAQSKVYGNSETRPKVAAGDLPAPGARSDGIYL
jgi:flagellar hook-length control protein FliK